MSIFANQLTIFYGFILYAVSGKFDLTNKLNYRKKVIALKFFVI